MPESVLLSVRYLCEFLLRGGSLDSRFSGGAGRAALGTRIHRRLQKQGGAAYTPEVPLSLSCEKGDFVYHLSGRADGVIDEDGRITVDEIKTTAVALDALYEDKYPEHFAQGCVYAHILCQTRNLSGAAVRLTYCNIDSGDVRRFVRDYTAEELAAFFDDLIGQYERWAARTATWAKKRNASLQAAAFPFAAYRAGQRQLAVACYRTFESCGRLLACAPTGTGKTISTLFPAMKAMGEGHGGLIFYLTSKTVTRKAAEDAIALLREKAGGLSFNSLTLTAKDKICFLEERACNPDDCPYANGYYDRVNDAVYDILQQGGPLGRAEVEHYAKKRMLCPYELSLDLALWCDCVICDYNYLFDPVVHLQRFFETGGDYLFLIDEAHNLVDRSRNMYTAQLRKGDFALVKKLAPKNAKRLRTALAAVNSAFLALAKRCAAGETAILRQENPFDELTEPVERFIDAAAAYLEDNRGFEWEKELLEAYFATIFYTRILEKYGEDFVSLAYKRGSDVTAKLLCLDAARFVDESLSQGRAAVFFSATLLPLPYYREVLGSEEAKLLALESPFPPENLGLFVAEGISTKYADRAASVRPVADMLGTMVEAKTGNYIAYFPSYKYMADVLQAFTEQYPDIKTHVQTGRMDEAAREEYLAAFAEAPEESMLGFCVLGGIFSEGVDLPGERLIGTAVVGVGLPQIGPEPDSVKDYYNEKNGCGFDFAYTFPGMNKVLQAAGRVIRTEEDRGVALLIDSRFATARYRALFPAHWAHRVAVTREDFPRRLQSFWGG